MANINLTDSSNIKVVQNGSDISLDFTAGGQVATNTTNIGTLANLTTTDKTDLVSAINEVDADTTVVDITSQITFNETVANTYFFKVGNVIHVQYQGAATTHSVGTTLATIPVAYRPNSNYQVLAPFVKNNNAYGTLQINSGSLQVGQISSTTVSGRIYANFSYYI